MSYNKILIVNLGGIGDVLLSTPALRALKNNFPQAQISILVVPRVYEIVKGLSYIDNIFIFYKGYSPISLFKNFFTLLALRKRHFDLLLNMRTIVSEKSARKIKFLINIIHPKLKVGRDTDGRGNFFDLKIPETYKGQKYEMAYDIETVEALSAEVADRSIDFKVDNASIEKIEKILEKEGIYRDDLLIGIHPGGRNSRRWPLENFSQVIAEIYKKISCKFVITGGKDEVSLVAKLVKMTNPKVINLANQLNIRELGALIKRCNLYISNDTGPMHIAAILEAPLIAIFGAGDVIRYDPRNIFGKAEIFHKKVECATCEKNKCKSLQCLIKISSEEVIKTALHFLK